MPESCFDGQSFSNRSQDHALPPDAAPPGGLNMPRIARVGVWAVFYFAFYLVQQVSELVAPLVLVLGIGWSALPHVIGIVNGRRAATRRPVT